MDLIEQLKSSGNKLIDELKKPKTNFQSGFSNVMTPQAQKGYDLLKSASNFTQTAMQPILNPGSTFATPTLEKLGVNPLLAGGIGLGLDILAPGPGELGDIVKGSKLLNEARKYKSAEEFVNKLKANEYTEIFHGTDKGGFDVLSKDFTKYDRKLLGKNTGQGDYFTSGISFTSDINTAKSYGKNVIPAYYNYMDNQILNINAGDFSKILKKYKIDENAKNFSELLTEKLKKDGYKGISVFDDIRNQFETTIIDPSILKTKSQLTDIWNQANKLPQTPEIKAKIKGETPTFKASGKKFNESNAGYSKLGTMLGVAGAATGAALIYPYIASKSQMSENDMYKAIKDRIGMMSDYNEVGKISKLIENNIPDKNKKADLLEILAKKHTQLLK